MKKSIIITLAIAAAIACTACGKQENETANPISEAIVATTSGQGTEVTTTVSTTAKTSKTVQTTSRSIAVKTSAAPVTTESTHVNTTAQTEQVIVTTSSAPILTTVTGPTTAAATTTSSTYAAEAAETTTTQPQTQPEPQRPAVTPPSPEDPDYAPAPIQYNIEGITYIQGALIANKSYSLPADFNPGLDPTCQKQFNKMGSDASKQGINLTFGSGFRSYSYQNTLYNNYVARDGQAAADTYSARAGYSEHQSGLAIDVNSISHYFDGTPEAQWLEEHCHEYGFILRYPKDKESITGYQYESWHIRYLGTDLSYPLHNSGLTLEEYFGIDSYYH